MASTPLRPSPLAFALHDNDLARVRQAIVDGADVDEADGLGITT